MRSPPIPSAPSSAVRSASPPSSSARRCTSARTGCATWRRSSRTRSRDLQSPLLSVERERRALRIHALRDAVAARHFRRAHHHLAVTLLHPPERGVEVLHVDVVEPVRRRRVALGPRHHPAEGAAALAVHLVGASLRPHLHRVGLLPAEELRVEAERGLPLASEELVPREVAVRRL